MKVRPQVAKPCAKKGMDNNSSSPFCECQPDCDKSQIFLYPDSKGTIRHNQSTITAFLGCLPLEEELIQNQLLRYESRELGGLEVLFEGIESIQNLNAEIFNDEGCEELNHDPIINLLTDITDNEQKLSRGNFTDEGLREYFPASLGYAQSSINALWADPPSNLLDSFFRQFYIDGIFDQAHDDIQQLSTCLFHGVDTPKEIKKIWLRYTEKRHQETLNKIWAIVHKKMPPWARRFHQIWDSLSEAQAEALKLEWFYENNEKQAQEENAKQLGISVASYQERLEWAYKKLSDLYPEFSRCSRKKPKLSHPAQILPFFDVRLNGEKVEIEFPQPKEKKLSILQRREIKIWSMSSTTDFLDH